MTGILAARGVMRPAAYAYLVAGGKIVEEKARTDYGMREIVIQDPDGHWICLGQDLERRDEDRGR